MADHIDHAPTGGAWTETALLLQPLRLARHLIGTLNARRQFLIRHAFCERPATRDFRIRQPRLHEGACVGGACLRILPVLCRNGGRACRACKDDFFDEPSTRVVVDALDGVGHGHAHLVLPCGIGRIEEEFAVLDGDGTHATCDHLPHDV